MRSARLKKNKMTAMSTPAIEILGLTKDYPVGFWRKRTAPVAR